MNPLSELRLKGIHPKLRAAITEILTEMEIAGHPMLVTDGVRSDKQQVFLYTLGRRGIKGERVVTFRDGIRMRSEHQPKLDGLGYAVDCCFLLDGKPSWDEHLPWETYGKLGESKGLHWGGRWLRPHDLPHLELPYPPPTTTKDG